MSKKYLVVIPEKIRKEAGILTILDVQASRESKSFETIWDFLLKSNIRNSERVPMTFKSESHRRRRLMSSINSTSATCFSNDMDQSL